MILVSSWGSCRMFLVERRTQRKETKMSAISMRDAIIRKYGKDSFEAGYIQWVFSRRSTETLWSVYKDLISE